MQMIVMIEVEQEFLAHWLGMTWISTVVGRADKDASGNRIDISMRSAMDRLRAWDRTQAYTPTYRNLRQAFSELERLNDKLRLSDVMIEKTA
jgi:transcription initiation factor TFIIB